MKLRNRGRQLGKCNNYHSKNNNSKYLFRTFWVSVTGLCASLFQRISKQHCVVKCYYVIISILNIEKRKMHFGASKNVFRGTELVNSTMRNRAQGGIESDGDSARPCAPVNRLYGKCLQNVPRECFQRQPCSCEGSRTGQGQSVVSQFQETFPSSLGVSDVGTALPRAQNWAPHSNQSLNGRGPTLLCWTVTGNSCPTVLTNCPTKKEENKGKGRKKIKRIGWKPDYPPWFCLTGGTYFLGWLMPPKGIHQVVHILTLKLQQQVASKIKRAQSFASLLTDVKTPYIHRDRISSCCDSLLGGRRLLLRAGGKQKRTTLTEL